MGLRDLLGWTAEPTFSRSAEDVITDAINERMASFTMSDALAMPPIARAVDVIVSIGSSMKLAEYRDGYTAPRQSRFIRRPDPFTTRNEFVEQTLHSIVEDGNWYWRLGSRDDRGYPRFALVLPWDEVDVQWDDRRFQRTYTWRGRTLVQGIDIVHGALNRRAGDLKGRSVLKEALPYLATIAAAEDYAAAAFGTNGIPLTVLKVASKMTKDEADTLKAQWATSRQETPYEPAVASGGVDPMFPSVDPQKMQMQEARSYGATVVARLLGVPAALMLIETSGSTIYYQNAEGALDAFAKTTLFPRYLNPLEAVLGGLLPGDSAARFTSSELMRADVKTRYEVYATGIESGVFTAREARTNEGLPPNPPETVVQYEGQLRPETDPTTIDQTEVPVYP